MKNLFCLLIILSVFYPAHTQQVSKEFGRMLVDDDFTRLSGKWNQESNADNLLIGSDKGFQTWRKNKKSGFFILPDKQEAFSVFETTVQLLFDAKGGKNQSAGMVLQAQADGSGAIIVEINRHKQYRIRRAMANRMVSLTGPGEGWVKNKKAISSGENLIMVRTYDKIYDLYINSSFIRSFTEIEYSEGQIGLYIGASSKVFFQHLTVKTDDDHVSGKTNQNGPVDEEKTLSQVIVKLKETINKKDKRIAELEDQLRNNAGKGSGSDTALLRQKRETDGKLLQCTRDIESVRMEREQLQTKLAALEEFKKQVQESENGDIIINLTKLSAKQKEQIDQLLATVKLQTATVEQLKKEKTELEKQIESKNTNSDQLQNNQIGLMQRLIEKDSVINALEEKLKLLDDALTAYANSKNLRDEGNRQPKIRKKRKAKKKEESILFDE